MEPASPVDGNVTAAVVQLRRSLQRCSSVDGAEVVQSREYRTWVRCGAREKMGEEREEEGCVRERGGGGGG